jgi:hypothetical protein
MKQAENVDDDLPLSNEELEKFIEYIDEDADSRGGQN